MNAPPPAKTLHFTTEGGDPLIVRVTHQGKKYILRINQTVLAVWPTGGVMPDGNPMFSVQAAPAMTIAEDTKTS